MPGVVLDAASILYGALEKGNEQVCGGLTPYRFYQVETQDPRVGGEQLGRSNSTPKKNTDGIREQCAVLCGWGLHCDMRLVLHRVYVYQAESYFLQVWNEKQLQARAHSATVGFGVGRGSDRACLVRARVFPGSFLGTGRNWLGWTIAGRKQRLLELTGVRAGMCLTESAWWTREQLMFWG